MAPAVVPAELPQSSLLRRTQDAGAYADCYVAVVDGAVSHAAFVEAFYTTPLFKIERLILALVAQRPSTDQQAQALAEGRAESFAAWRVAARSTDQLLLADVTGRTQSWLMVEPRTGGARSTGAGQTALYFGSAVLPKPARNGARRIGFVFHALLGFHRLYSKRLLAAACSRLAAGLAAARQGGRP